MNDPAKTVVQIVAITPKAILAGSAIIGAAAGVAIAAAYEFGKYVQSNKQEPSKYWTTK